MSVHTPGPWQVKEVQLPNLGSDGEWIPAETWPVYTEGGEWVAQWVRSEAAARLIAAAPDLLAALELLYATVEALVDANLDRKGKELVLGRGGPEAARAAIAKAKGKVPAHT